MNWGYAIRKLREYKGMTQQELADASGLKRSHLSVIELGRIKSAQEDTLQALSKGLGMPIEELTQEIYGKPTEPVQKPALPPLAPGKMEVQRISVYSQFPFHAGAPTELAEYVYRAIPKESARHVEGYVVRGTCLTPVVNDGDTIIVDRNAAVENGDIVACMIDGELHIARLKRYSDELWLENNNSKHKIQDCMTSAKVIEVVRRL